MAKTRTWTLLACALLALGACKKDEGDGGGGGGGSTTSTCATVCPKLTALNCPGDVGQNCMTECEMQVTMNPSCATQTQAYLSCMAARPATDFECDADGDSGLKAGVCMNELSAVATCALSGMAGTGGGMAGTGAGGCIFVNDGECDEPDICPAGTDTADCSGG